MKGTEMKRSKGAEGMQKKGKRKEWEGRDMEKMG